MHVARPKPTVLAFHNRLRITPSVKLSAVTGGRLAGTELGQRFQETDELELVVSAQGGDSGVHFDEHALPGRVADGATDAGNGFVGDGGLERGAETGAADVAAVAFAAVGDVDW